MPSPLQKKYLVDSNAATAFDIFVNHLDRWWPVREHSVSGAKGLVPLAVHVDAHVGGAITETMQNGTKATWGHVLDIQQGAKFSTTWHPSHTEKVATRLDVFFQNAPLDRCKVTLIHSGWKVWGTQAPKRREMYNGGWDYVVGKCFAESVVELLA